MWAVAEVEIEADDGGKDEEEKSEVGRRRGKRKIQVVVKGYLLSSVEGPLLNLYALVNKYQDLDEERNIRMSPTSDA